jgi:acetate kinase
MGFTPLDGLVMATRSGAIDPGLILWVQRRGLLSTEETEHALEREAGLRGLSGGSGDMQEVLAGVDAGDERCRLAVDVYIHRLAASVAAMAASMNGLDALVFTGGVGEHAPQIRARVAASLGFLGVTLDPVANAEIERDGMISTPGDGAATVVVRAREDIEIARQTRAALG